MTKEPKIKAKAPNPKESQLGKALMQLFAYAQAGGRIPREAILVKNVNERKSTPTKEKDDKVVWKDRIYSKRVLDHLYVKGLIAQGMILGLYDYTFKYPVEVNGQKFSCFAEIELKRDATESLSYDQEVYRQRLDKLGTPNMFTHDPEVALEFMVRLINYDPFSESWEEQRNKAYGKNWIF